jgi:hypothetical protein
LRRMSAIVLIEKEKIDGRPLEGIAIQVSFTLNNGRITHMEKTRASQFDDEGLAN